MNTTSIKGLTRDENKVKVDGFTFTIKKGDEENPLAWTPLVKNGSVNCVRMSTEGGLCNRLWILLYAYEFARLTNISCEIEWRMEYEKYQHKKLEEHDNQFYGHFFDPRKDIKLTVIPAHPQLPFREGTLGLPPCNLRIARQFFTSFTKRNLNETRIFHLLLNPESRSLFRPSSLVKRECLEFWTELGSLKDYHGIHYRGGLGYAGYGDFRNRKTFEEYLHIARSKSNFRRFIASDNPKSIDTFKENLANVYHQDGVDYSKIIRNKRASFMRSTMLATLVDFWTLVFCGSFDGTPRSSFTTTIKLFRQIFLLDKMLNGGKLKEDWFV